MNIYYVSIIMLVSTTWMLRVLDHHQYHILTTRSLVAHAKQEYLLKGIEAYVKAYYIHYGSVPRHLSYPLKNESLALSLIEEGEAISVTVQLGTRLHTREISV